MSSTFTIHSSAIVRATFCCLILAGPAAQHSVGAIFTLADLNSTSQFNTTTQANDFNWQVDGVNQLAQQAFWYRIGNVAEQSVHILPIAVQGATDSNFDGNPDTLFVRYVGNGVQIETGYRLHGGAPGSGASDMSEQISVTNLTDGPMDFHFFQYANFDLNGTPGGDVAVFTNPNTVRQSEAGTELTETVVTPVPSHREIAVFPVTLNNLNDGLPTTLSDTPPIGVVAGPHDMTWAYQWDFFLPPGDTFQISKDKNLHAGAPIPEPAAGCLLSLAAGWLLAGYRKRNAA